MVNDNRQAEIIQRFDQKYNSTVHKFKLLTEERNKLNGEWNKLKNELIILSKEQNKVIPVHSDSSISTNDVNPKKKKKKKNKKKKEYEIKQIDFSEAHKPEYADLLSKFAADPNYDIGDSIADFYIEFSKSHYALQYQNLYPDELSDDY